MQMRHRFAPVWPVIDDQAVASLRQAGFFGHFTRFEQQVSKNLSLFGPGFGDSWQNFLRKNQKVRRRLRMDVADGHDQIIFVKNL